MSPGQPCLDKEKNETLVVGIGDQIKNGAEVVRIERRRVVMTENGAPRELTFGDEGGSRAARSRPVDRAARPPRAPARSRGNPSPPKPRETIDKRCATRKLFSQARILPKYDKGQMVGVQVNAIKPGSLFEQIGIQNGDMITEFNGIEIDGPSRARGSSASSEREQFNVVVRVPRAPRRPRATRRSERRVATAPSENRSAAARLRARAAASLALLRAGAPARTRRPAPPGARPDVGAGEMVTLDFNDVELARRDRHDRAAHRQELHLRRPRARPRHDRLARRRSRSSRPTRSSSRCSR